MKNYYRESLSKEKQKIYDEAREKRRKGIKKDKKKYVSVATKYIIWTPEKIKEYVESRGFKLLEIINSKRKIIKVECSNNHISKKGLHSFIHTIYGCKICGNKERFKNQKTDINYIKEEMKKRGDTLLSKTYKNIDTKLNIRCKNNHEYKTTLRCYKTTKIPCTICRNTIKFNKIKKEVERSNCIILNYDNTESKFKCENNHEFTMSNMVFYHRKYKCPECFKYSEPKELFKIGKRRCAICKEIKELKDFHKSKNVIYGYSSNCKVCKSIIDKKRQSTKKYRLYINNRRNTPKERLNCSMSSGIYISLKSNKENKSWKSLVPYTLTELQNHLEKRFTKGMNWNNYGEWHIDHIIPQVAFTYDSFEDEEFKMCWCLNNLNPMIGTENSSKCASLNYYTENELENFGVLDIYNKINKK